MWKDPFVRALLVYIRFDLFVKKQRWVSLEPPTATTRLHTHPVFQPNRISLLFPSPPFCFHVSRHWFGPSTWTVYSHLCPLISYPPLKAKPKDHHLHAFLPAIPVSIYSPSLRAFSSFLLLFQVIYPRHILYDQLLEDWDHFRCLFSIQRNLFLDKFNGSPWLP